MPSGSFYQAYVLCPFYRWDDGKKRITCEGIVEDSSIALIYRYRADYDCQIRTFCCEHYEKCEVYRLLMDKYEDGPTCKPSKKPKKNKPRKTPRIIENQLCLFFSEEV